MIVPTQLEIISNNYGCKVVVELFYYSAPTVGSKIIIDFDQRVVLNVVELLHFPKLKGKDESCLIITKEHRVTDPEYNYLVDKLRESFTILDMYDVLPINHELLFDKISAILPRRVVSRYELDAKSIKAISEACRAIILVDSNVDDDDFESKFTDLDYYMLVLSSSLVGKKFEELKLVFKKFIGDHINLSGFDLRAANDTAKYRAMIKRCFSKFKSLHYALKMLD